MSSFLSCFWDSLVECLAGKSTEGRLPFSGSLVFCDHLLEALVTDKYCPASKKLLYAFLCLYWHESEDLVMKTDLLPERKWVFWLIILVERLAQAVAASFSCVKRFLFYWLTLFFFK